MTKKKCRDISGWSDSSHQSLVSHLSAALWLSCLIVSCLTGFDAASAQGTRRRTATPASQGSFDQLTKKALEAREASRIDEAIALYQQAVKTRPAWDEGWWSLGTLFYELDRYAEGRDAFRRLVALAPKSGPGWVLLGLCEYRLREYQQALLHIQRGRSLGLGQNPELTAVTLYHAAILMNRFGEFELAFDTLQRLTKIQDETPTLMEAFGLTMLRLSYLPEEVPLGKREMMLKTGRAAYFAAADRRAEAQQEYRELLALFPQAPGVHYAYGVFLLRDSPEAALEEFQREIQISPDHLSARLQIAFEALKQNRAADGLTAAEEAVKLDPKLFAARNALGRILLEMGQIERAVKELETGTRMAPDSPEMHFALARAYSRLGRKAEADRERAEFMRLDKIRRASRENQIGTEQSKPEANPRPQ